MTNRAAAPKSVAAGDTITCGFCRGAGKDPFGLLSERSTCQVCWGTGIVELSPPRRRCVFCSGSGVYPDSRLTCTVCGGKGANTVMESAAACAACKGSGKSDVSLGHQPCVTCRGVGFVAPRGEVAAAPLELRRHAEGPAAPAGVGKKGGARRGRAASARARSKTKRAPGKARAA